MKRTILGLWLAITAVTSAEISGGKLLDDILSHPGSYSQVCDVMSAPADLPYRAYEPNDFAGASFSKANLALINANREALVKAIRARLLEIDFTRATKDPAKDPKPEESMDGEDTGCDPESLNPLLLDLISELKATETLPELLAVEDRLVKGIAVAKDDAKARPPIVYGWFVAQEGDIDENESEAKRDRRINLFQARVAQRDLVMLMATLLREKSYEPFLKTGIEAAYVKGLKAQAKEYGLDRFPPGERLPAELDGWEITFDPITRLPMRKHSPVSIPYTRESRDEVRAAAAQWIVENP